MSRGSGAGFVSNGQAQACCSRWRSLFMCVLVFESINEALPVCQELCEGGVCLLSLYFMTLVRRSCCCPRLPRRHQGSEGKAQAQGQEARESPPGPKAQPPASAAWSTGRRSGGARPEPGPPGPGRCDQPLFVACCLSERLSLTHPRALVLWQSKVTSRRKWRS